MISSQIPDLTPLTDNERKLTAAVEKTQAILERLHAENESLRAELDERKKLVTVSPEKLRAAMYEAQHNMAYDEYTRKDLGTAAIAFDYLLRELEVHHD